MKRTQVQFDEPTYEMMRRRAFERGVSMAKFVREAVREYLKTVPARRKRLEDFSFIASGYSSESEVDPISERHDEALTEDFAG